MPRRYVDGPAIVARRKERGWSRYEFARRSGVSISYLKVIEALTVADESTQPRPRILTAIADTLGCDTDDISQVAEDHIQEAA